MENIFEPTVQFDFSQLNCISPAALSGGNYFIRILTSSQNPFYVRSPKCFTKSGILKSGKKLLCDLVFQYHDEHFLDFLEHLEEFCQKQIYDNKDKWFEPGLTMVDIENCFISPAKTYKSGKYHNVRCHVPIRMGKCNLKIFDEQENDVPIEDIKENTPVMTILEVQGIRCSVRSFQIEFEIKQMMTLKPTDSLFEKCVLSKPLGKISAEIPIENTDRILPEMTMSVPNTHTSLEEIASDLEASKKNSPPSEDLVIIEETNKEDKSEINSQNILETLTTTDSDTDVDDIFPNPSTENSNEKPENTLSETKPLEKNEESDMDDLCEIHMEIPKDSEEIKLKNPNEKHYKLYKDAKRKAKIARDLAISEYLEAKQIKHQYLLDEICSDEEEMMLDEKELKQLEFDKDS